MIENKIQEIINEVGKSIIVLKGFNVTDIPDKNKYFSFHIDYYDNLNLDIIGEQVVDEVIDNRKFDSDYRGISIV